MNKEHREAGNSAGGASPRVIPREYLLAFILVTSLFFLWAIAHNLNDILIRQFQKALDLSRGEAGFIQISFYLAYVVAAIPAGYTMKRLGFKPAILIGLVLYATGAALFYPAAEVRVYGFFLAALFIIACGIVFLETSGSGYITLVGDPRTATQRINFSQSFNGVGGITAPLIGGLFIFSGVEYTPDQLAALSPGALESYRAGEARQVQTPYLSIAALVVVIASLVALTRFPSASRGSLQGMSQGMSQGLSQNRAQDRARDNTPGMTRDKRPRVSLAGLFRHRSFTWAIIAQFFYVGAQIGVWSYFIDFTKELSPATPEKSAAFYLSASLFSFMLGRFVGTFLMNFFAPRRLLGAYALINVALVLIAISASGLTAVLALGATSFFMSIMFPTIYALGLARLGEQAEIGSSLIIMTIISGAIMPPLMGYFSDAVDVQSAYLLPLMAYALVFVSTIAGREPAPDGAEHE